ncbi:unnamed protein product, partial [Rotaria magnacalcarata]
MHATSSSHGAT